MVQEICDEMGITLQEVAYIGDDVNCKELLTSVGFPACPADAMTEITSLPNIRRMTKKGGEGCVREYVELIINALSK